MKYYAKGFYQFSSKSKEDEEGFKNNKIEYRYNYNKENQTIKFYKKLETTTTFSEMTSEFNYINNTIIEVKSNRKGGRFPIFYDQLLYKVEYY